jgi:hypothetical protein
MKDILMTAVFSPQSGEMFIERLPKKMLRSRGAKSVF